MSTTTTTTHPDLTKRDEAVARYEAALVLAKNARSTAEKHKASGALSGPLQAVRHAESRLFLAEVGFEPYVPETVRKSDGWNEADATKAVAKLGSAWKRAKPGTPFEYLRADYDRRLNKALKAAADHGVTLDDPRKS